MKVITVYDIERQIYLIKPDTAQLRNNDPYYVPPFAERVEVRPFLLTKVVRIAKNIDVRFAGRLYDSLSFALEFAAADLLEKCRTSGLPWDMALSYDKSTAVPNLFLPVADALDCEWGINGQSVARIELEGVKDMVDSALSMLTRCVTLKIGDLVLLPFGGLGAKIETGDYVTLSSSGERIFDFDIK